MRQLRLSIFLPLALVALGGVGFGALAYGQAPETSAPPAVRPHHPNAHTPGGTKPTKPVKPPTKPASPPVKPKTELERAFAAHRMLVVVFYAPGGSLDDTIIREARAGALSTHAGFLALNVTRNGAVTGPAKQYDVYEAPAILVFRGRHVVSRFDTYADRETVAQAIVNAR